MILKLLVLWVGILTGICFPYFQGYAWEITTVEGGYGLQDLLSSRKSVINGTVSINLDFYDLSLKTFL